MLKKINIRRYDRIKKISNFFLKLNNPIIKCNNVVNLINDHPNHINKSLILDSKNYFIIHLLKNLFYQPFKIILKLFILRFNEFNSLKKKKKLIIFSHLVDEQIIKSQKDHSFGKIFLKNKSDIGIVYWDHAITHKKKINKKNFQNFFYDVCILNLNESFINIIKHSMILIKIFLNFKLQNNNKVYKNGFNYLKANILSLDSLRILIYKKKIKKIIEETKPNFIITTFEGHGYEKLIFSTVKEVNQNIKRIGYQNSIMSKKQNSMLIKHNDKYMPDYIFASGEVSYLRLKRKFKKSKVFLFGSSRNILKKVSKPKGKGHKINCLVIPEGLDYSIIKLFNFCILYCKKFNDVSFTFRFHPEVNIKEFFNKYNYLNEYKKFNIKISKNKNHKKDFQNSNIALYIQSSLVIDALKHGLKPFYLKDNKYENLDIFYNFKNNFRVIVKNIDDFNLKIKKYQKNQNKNSLQDFKNLVNFSDKLYSPINEKIVFKIFQNNL